MGRWRLKASPSRGCPSLVLATVCVTLLTRQIHSAAIRSRRESPISLTLALSDLHNDIYTGSNREDGDGNLGNMMDVMSPDPAPAPEVAAVPDPAPVPDPSSVPPSPDPAPAPEPAQPAPPRRQEPPQFHAGPDPSNTEDGDGHGNNGGPDIPSVDPIGQQQQQQQDQQQQQQEDQQQQQQAGATTPAPAPPPDTPEPLPPSEIKSNAADAVPDTGSSEEKTGKTGGSKNGGGGAGGLIKPNGGPIPPTGSPAGAPDGVGFAYGAPDPFDPFGPHGQPGPLVPKFIDPFDPFINSIGGAPPPPPPPPPPPNAVPTQNAGFGGSINMGAAAAALPPPPPPPPPTVIISAPILGDGIMPAIGPPPAPPLEHPLIGPNVLRVPHSPHSPHSPSTFREGSGPNPLPRSNQAREKAPIEKMSAAEAKSLALDKQNDFIDAQQEKADTLRSRANAPAAPERPPPPLPQEIPERPQQERPEPVPQERPEPSGPSAAELKGLARDRLQDALDRRADALAMRKERQPPRFPFRG